MSVKDVSTLANGSTPAAEPHTMPVPLMDRLCASIVAIIVTTGTSQRRQSNSNSASLITSLLPLAEKRASYYASKWHSCSYEDAYSDALLAAVVAVEQWQPDKHASLHTYASAKMDGYIRHGFRDRSWQKRYPLDPARELVSWNTLECE